LLQAAIEVHRSCQRVGLGHHEPAAVAACATDQPLAPPLGTVSLNLRALPDVMSEDGSSAGADLGNDVHWCSGVVDSLSIQAQERQRERPHKS